MADSYQGPVRVLGGDGILLTMGIASLEPDPEKGNWKGLLQVLQGAAVAGKALVVELELPEGSRGRAQLTPLSQNGDKATSSVVGLGTQPF